MALRVPRHHGLCRGPQTPHGDAGGTQRSAERVAIRRVVGQQVGGLVTLDHLGHHGIERCRQPRHVHEHVSGLDQPERQRRQIAGTPAEGDRRGCVAHLVERHGRELGIAAARDRIPIGREAVAA
jgi:hypothetical protein